MVQNHPVFLKIAKLGVWYKTLPFCWKGPNWAYVTKLPFLWKWLSSTRSTNEANFASYTFILLCLVSQDYTSTKCSYHSWYKTLPFQFFYMLKVNYVYFVLSFSHVGGFPSSLKEGKDPYGRVLYHAWFAHFCEMGEFCPYVKTCKNLCGRVLYHA